MTASETPSTAPAAPAGDVLAGAIDVDTTRPLGRLDDRVYGHFLESNFFGNIEGGVFDEGSPLALSAAGPTGGLRRDVIESCRRLGVPIVRWPGGNFASAYHWEDGIGPRDARPRRLELTWGGVESNRFGTDEFLAWCAAAGAEPYLNNSCRSVDEAVRWVEYTNHAADTHYTRLRAANGHPDPYAVRYWGLGNEAYGRWQMGHRPAEQYAADAREHAHFMRLVDPTLKLVAVGWRTEEWTRALLRQAGGLIDYVSIHLYGASRHLYTPEDDEFDSTVGQALHFEAELRAYADLVAQEARRAGVERPLALALDEWNIRHLEPETWPAPAPGPDGRIAPRDLPVTDPAAVRRVRVNRWSPRTLADALFYAGVFHALHRLCGHTVPVGMANTVNLINANALLAVRPSGLVHSATYHVWDLYQNHMGRTCLPVTVECPGVLRPLRRSPQPDASGQLPARPAIVPYLDGTATLSDDRRTLHLCVINRHRTAAVRAPIHCAGTAAGLPPRARHWEIGTGETDVLATNGLDTPDRVALRGGGTVEVPQSGYVFPPHAVTLLAFELA